MPYLVKLSVLILTKGYDDGFMPTRHLFAQVIQGENVYFGSCILMSLQLTVIIQRRSGLHQKICLFFFHPNFFHPLIIILKSAESRPIWCLLAWNLSNVREK